MLEKVIFRGIIKEVEVATIPCADGAKLVGNSDYS